MKVDLQLPKVDIRVRTELRYTLIYMTINKRSLIELAEGIGIRREKLYRTLRGDNSYRQQQSVVYELLQELPKVSLTDMQKVNSLLDEIHTKVNVLGGESSE
ncbi:hypothetical protein ABES96_23630 [Bacillus nitratireducens]|uniref:hypothetical protein n=1 Tax=Bacillus nitratireducens TaxID=2026193 RepID=UPI000BFB078F|nr:hypothetical protein CN467_14220 [Bacillus cereus]